MCKRRQILTYEFPSIAHKSCIKQSCCSAYFSLEAFKERWTKAYFSFFFIPFLILYCIYNTPNVSAQSWPTYILDEQSDLRMDLSDSLRYLLDEKGSWTIEEILKMPYTSYVSDTVSFKLEASAYIWTKLDFYNSGKHTLHMYLSYCSDAHSFSVFEVAEDKVLNEEYAGKDQRIKERFYPAKYLYTPFSLGAGERRTLVFRVQFQAGVSSDHFVHLRSRSQPLVHHYLSSDYSWQAFYAGVMLLFGVLSLFLYILFRKKSFVFFALQTFFFALYFIEFKGMIEAFFTNYFQLQGWHLVELFVSGLVISSFLFVSEYTSLKSRYPPIYKTFLLFTIGSQSLLMLAVLVGVPYEVRATAHNVFLLFWVSLSAGIIVFMALKGVKESRVLLLSLTVLFIGSLFYLVVNHLVFVDSLIGLIFFQLGTILSSGILFYSLFTTINEIIQSNIQMEEMDKLKSDFFANISHEFRTPLTLIMGPLQQLSETMEDPNSKKLIGLARQHAERQLALVNQLLALSTLDAGDLKFSTEIQDFVPFVRGAVHAFESYASDRNIALDLSCSDEALPIAFHREKMLSILNNLLSNSFKFTEEGGRISVYVEKVASDVVEIRVCDTGKGIDPEELPFVFDRFFQGKQSQTSLSDGSGIGLALCKELVLLHDGDIRVESKLGEGSSFILQFPLADGKLSLSGDCDQTESLPVVLLIEDNGDMRFFIRQRLQTHFHLEEAGDGKEGVQRAKELMPDLIISDVMMPEMDGYQVCQNLKSDIQTCHIPIILLTAKASVGEKIEGLETGADDYLTKPFDATELLVRSQNLIQSRQILRQRFASALSIKASEMAVHSRDKVFLELVVQKIEEGITAEGFRVDDLAAAVGMSKPNLNRKLRALLDQSTNQFIQSIRLQRAAELLRQDAGTVAEVAIQTGFSSTAYFVKCFKDKYGETPGAFTRNQ